jgi:hypothetical protein
MKNKLSAFALFIIILTAFAVRLYKIDNPIADWHSWRQADTAAVTRNFVKSGVDLLHPRFDDLSNIPSGKENPQGYRMVEFPIYNLLHYLIYKSSTVPCSMFHVPCSLEFAGRLTTLLASLLSLTFLYSIVNKLSGSTTAILSTFFFAVLPYNIYYSRVILPDPLMVTCTLGATWFFLKWLETIAKKSSNPTKNAPVPGSVFQFLTLKGIGLRFRNVSAKPTGTPYFLLSALLAAASLLLKPTAIFLLLPLAYLIFSNPLKKRHSELDSESPTQHKSTFKTSPSKLLLRPSTILFPIIVILPFTIWRLWIQQFPAGIPANFWLLNGDGIRFRPAWFRWLFHERLGNLILGGFGLVPFILGILSKPKKFEGLFYLFALISLLLYLIIFATGNVRHDYYQIPLVPIVCIFLAKGIVELWTNKDFSKILSIPTSLFLILSSLLIGWYNIRGYYQINHPEIIAAGQTANQLFPENAKVIAPYQGDTAFLYQTNRPGWPAVTTSIDQMINLGATHYVSVNYDQTTNDLMLTHPILKQTDKFIIIQLSN